MINKGVVYKFFYGFFNEVVNIFIYWKFVSIEKRIRWGFYLWIIIWYWFILYWIRKELKCIYFIEDVVFDNCGVMFKWGFINKLVVYWFYLG